MKTLSNLAAFPVGLSPELAFAVLEKAPLGIVIRDGTQAIWINRVLREEIESAGHEASDLQGSDPPDTRLAKLLSASERIDLTNPGGKARCWERCSVEHVGGGSVSVSFYRDAAREAALQESIERLERRLATLETRDPDTGLLNRQGLTAALDRELGRSRRYGNPVSVVRLDLAATHRPDDQETVLRELSQEFRARLRWADELGRLRLDQFLMILPETTEESAKTLAENLLGAPILTRRRTEGWNVTAVVACWQKGDDRRRLLLRAGVED